MTTEVGGPIYIGDTPGGESFPEYDSTIDKQIYRYILAFIFTNESSNSYQVILPGLQ